ncbi:hypothetical protein [Patulibacter minatonensis]|uniref:hypothetical protein n=1 Tax=Patulibacter minatonensis TaxID=298163 RepID=UPI0004787895|nr:hypothetical protein [Patulibacter minatonensis]
MLSRSALHRPAAVLAAAALAVGVAGCGGSDGDGKGGGSYASTWNDVCTSLTSAATTLQNQGNEADKVARGDQEKKIAELAKPTGQLLATFRQALDKVKGLDAPDEFKDFQQQVSDSAPGTIKAIDKVKDPVESGDPKAFTRAMKSVDVTKPFPALPAALKKQAAACSAF